MGGHALPAGRHRRRRRRRPLAAHALDRRAGPRRGRRGRPRPVRRRRAGRGHAGRRGAGRDPARRPQAGASCSRTRSTTPRGHRRARVPPPRPRRPDPALGPARPRHRRPAGRGRRAPAGRRAGQSRRRGDPRRDPRPAERRQVEPPERAPRRGAGDRLRRRPARRATRSTRVFERGERTFVLVDTAGLRRKRRQRQGIEYYSELRALDAAERADVALVLVDASEGARRPGPRRRRRRAQGAAARRSSCSRNGTSARSKIEDVRPAARGAAAPAAPARHRLGEDGPRRPRLLDRVEELFAKHTRRHPDRPS